jgi:uncharacterized protein YkwD
MLPPPLAVRVPTKGGPVSHGVCLLRPIRTVRTAVPQPFESLGRLLSSHRAVTRFSLAALSFVILAAFSQQATIQAGPEQAPLVPESLLPQSIGRGVSTDATVTVPFDAAMDRASVEASLQILPTQKVELTWNDRGTELTIAPERRWRTDERYLVVVGRTAATAAGSTLEHPERYAFTTQAAPAITDFQLSLSGGDLPAADATTEAATLSSRAGDATSDEATSADVRPPTETATEVSATTSITIGFSAEMDEADVESRFAIAPAVAGDLTWDAGQLVFTPTERLVPGARYTISVNGAHDRRGNPLGGELNFSFIVQAGAQLITTDPKLGASDVEPATVEMWFSQPMDVDATNAAFAPDDTTTGAPVGGRLVWNDAGTQVIYTPDRPLAGGRTFDVTIGDGGLDAAGNPVTASWSFTTKAAPVASTERSSTAASTRSTTTATAPAIGPVPPASSLVGYALNQINAARAAYGFAPLALDSGITAVATAHAWDQLNNGYYSHTSLSGATLYNRLAAGGVAFSSASENQCHYYGQSAQATLDWCHSAFMSEPYPGYWNHIGNILNPKWTRVGVGIADNGSHVIITWDFAN